MATKDKTPDQLHPLVRSRVEQEGAPATDLRQRMAVVESSLYLALEAKGHAVESGAAVVLGERFTFHLYEPSRQVWVPIPKTDWLYKITGKKERQELVPSGRPVLVAVPEDRRHGGGERRWEDKKKRLEDQIDNIVRRFEIIAQNIKLERANSEAREREREARLALAADRLRRERQFQKLGEDLQARADAWSEAQRLRGFLEAVESRLTGQASPAMLRWLDWARGHVEQIDPLASLGWSQLQRHADTIDWGAMQGEELSDEEQEWRANGDLDELL